MKAAVLHQLGGVPRFGEFPEPRPGEGEVVIEVEAAGVSHLDLGKASGSFYTGPPPLPSVVGSDGVGRLADGRRVFFDAVVPPFGSMAERALVPREAIFEVAEGAGSTLAAGLGNTGLGAWLALDWRAELKPGETVLVLGASGALGSAAVQIARALGAGRVVAAVRSAERVSRLGADATVELDRDHLPEAFKEACEGGADVTIDPLWGPPALAAMGAANHGARHVQVGQMASQTLELAAAQVRAPGLDLLGFALFHAPPQIRHAAYLRMTELAARGGLEVEREAVPLAEVAEAWGRQGRGPGVKLVIAVSERSG